MTELQISILSILATCILFRIYWMFKNIRSYILVMASYAKLNNISIDEIKPKCKLSPLLTIFLELSHWDFTRYIYNKEFYYEVCVFHVEYMFKALGLSEDKTKTVETEKDSQNNK